METIAFVYDGQHAELEVTILPLYYGHFWVCIYTSKTTLVCSTCQLVLMIKGWADLDEFWSFVPQRVVQHKWWSSFFQKIEWI